MMDSFSETGVESPAGESNKIGECAIEAVSDPADAIVEWMLDSSVFAAFGDCHRLRFVSAGLAVEAGVGSCCSRMVDSDREFAA